MKYHYAARIMAIYYFIKHPEVSLYVEIYTSIGVTLPTTYMWISHIWNVRKLYYMCTNATMVSLLLGRWWKFVYTLVYGTHSGRRVKYAKCYIFHWMLERGCVWFKTKYMLGSHLVMHILNERLTVTYIVCASCIMYNCIKEH